MAERVALVTGSSRGIGKAVLLRLAGEHRCVIHYRRDAERAAEVAGELAWYGVETATVQGDVSSSEDVDAVVDAALDAFGRIDTLVVSAAATSFRPTTTAQRHHVGRTMETVVGGFVHLVRRCTPAMAPGGRVVSIGGLDARFAQAGHGVLGAAKAALEALTRSLAVELGPAGITVNCVIPGAIDTDSLRLYFRDREDELLPLLVDQTPMGRLGRVDDVAALVAFLCSREAGFLTGQSIVVDGGISAQGGPWGAFRSLWDEPSARNG